MKFYILSIAMIFSFGDVSSQNLSLPAAPGRDNLSDNRSISETLFTCNNWLRTSMAGESVKIGVLDVPGNSITVEALYNRLPPAAGSYILEDIVSKHGDPGNVNYLLRPDHAEITTTNGFFQTAPICITLPNRTYHVAFVYDGTTLKFYRNGFLMSQVPASGNLILNNLSTTIGDYAYPNPLGSNFIGYINEVKIWNTARTQSQIQANMNSSLPNPTTQPGLLAYYTFDNLLNKQGNPAWNGALSGAATINNTNPACTFSTDSCNVLQGIGNVINDYTPVVSLNPCNNSVNVENAVKYNIGDTVLIMQMKGSTIDSSNSMAFGNIINYQSAGNYEFNYISQKSGNTLYLKNKLTRQYEIPFGKVQLVRVPYFRSVNVSATLSCLPWDGSKGGVLVFHVKDTLQLNANIDVSNKGFKGGIGVNTLFNALTCGQTNYYYPNSSILAALKGENASIISSDKSKGRGAAANGGGGGQDHNSGGGGGANGTAGGFGGYQYFYCPDQPFDNRGIGGKPLTYSNTLNKVFLGGGGGAGHCNNLGFNADGGNGGGIIIIKSSKIINNNWQIRSNGGNAAECTQNGDFGYCHEGMGGGGSGGSILIDNSAFVDATSVNIAGGKGGNMSGENNGMLGPGGGGSGGVLWLKNNTLPAGFSVAKPGGPNGINVNIANSSWGATPGQNGINLFNLLLPFDTILFKKNIDSTRFKDTAVSCNSFNFQGLSYINTTPITSWQWAFGDGAGASTQNTSHSYQTAGSFPVTLVVTDANGCKDSVTRTVSSSPLAVSAGADTSFCQNGPVSHVLQGSSTGTTLSWSPAPFLNNSSLQNPTATITATTTFYLTASNAFGCTGNDSITITMNPTPVLSIQNNPSICTGDTLLLLATGVQSFQWLPQTSVSNPAILNPVFTGTSNQNIIVSGVNAFGCLASDTLAAVVKTRPVVSTIADTSFCSTQAITLFSSGALSYSWSPAFQLSNPTAQNPVFTGNTSQTYIVTGTASNGCSAKDTVSLTLRNTAFNAPPDKSMCIGGSVQLDGNNGNTMQYVWSPATYLAGASTKNPIASPPASTTFDVVITDAACNFDSLLRVTVTVNQLPLISADKENDIDCAHLSSRLSASGGINYLWSPASTLNYNSISNPIARPISQTQYIVTGTDANGCSNTDSVTVDIKGGTVTFYLANSFTPNGDGLNDCFGISHWGNMSDLIFMIYNRYGEKVFETKNAATCWDGYVKGRPSDPGGYVYYIKGKSGCGDVVRKGNLLLIR